MWLLLLTAPEERDPSAQGSKMGQALFESFDPRAATGIEIVESMREYRMSKSIEVSQTEKDGSLSVLEKPTILQMLIIR